MSDINRRRFIQNSIAASLGATFLPLHSMNLKSQGLGIVVHSYANRWKPKTESAKYPGFQNAIDLLEHSASIGATGIQVTLDRWTTDFAKKVRDRREKLGMYLEGSIGLPKDDASTPAFEQLVVNAKEAGATVIRTVCLNGRRYENFKTAVDFATFKTNSLAAIQRAEPIVRKHKIKLAIENHKDWRATELSALMKQINSEWVGVTLDFGNSISLMEDPNNVVDLLLPWLFSTHVKDMGLEEYPEGFMMSEVPLGLGMLDLKGIFDKCRKQNPSVTFNLEMITRDPLEIPCLRSDYWATFGEVNGVELARTLKMVREKKALKPLPRVSQLGVDDRIQVEESNILQSIAFTRSFGL
jgi:sugar phosphate isomerase/epimerase